MSQVDRLVEGLTEADAVRLRDRAYREAKRATAGLGLAPLIGEVDLIQGAWAMGALAMRNAMLGRHICRICGCWELQACPPTCSWVEIDLCSACDPTPSTEELVHVG